MIKLFVSDIDHTMYDSEADKIPPSVVSAVKELKKTGIIIALASSRVMEGVTEYRRLFDLDHTNGYVLASNGTDVIRCADNKPLVNQPFKKEDILKLAQLAKQLNLVFTVTHQGVDITTAYTHIIDYDYSKVKLDVLVTHDVLKHLVSPVYHILLSKGDEDMHQYVSACEKIGAGRYNFIVSQKGVIDISPAGVDKRFGLLAIIADMGISYNEVAVIGDNDNDLVMFDGAGYSGCVANGSLAARQKADVVVPSCNQGGVAVFIQQLLNKQGAK